MSRTAIRHPLPEFVVHNGNASAIGPCHGNDQPVPEVRLWMIARIPIPDLSIDERHFLECKLANVIPLLPVADLVEITPLFEDKATHVVGCRLFGVEVETQCGSQRGGAHANIGNIVGCPKLDVQKQVRSRRCEIARVLQPRPGASRPCVEPKSLQNEKEQAILLEAVPTATPSNQFLDECVGLEAYRLPEQNVQVLEGNAC